MLKIITLLGGTAAFTAAQSSGFEAIIGDGSGTGQAGKPLIVFGQKPTSDQKLTPGTKPAPSPLAVKAAMSKLPNGGKYADLVGGIKEGFVASALTPAMGNLDGEYESMRVKVVDAKSGKLANFWDFEKNNEFYWVPIDDGTFDVTVTGRRVDGTEEVLPTQTVTIKPSEGLSPSTMPLVLHYGAPACPVGSEASVRFRTRGKGPWTPVPAKACRGEDGTNFYVAGLYPSTTYEAQHKVNDGEWSSSSTGTSGKMDPEVDIPFGYENVPGLPKSDSSAGVIFHHHLFTRPHKGQMVGGSVATDMDGDIIWYYKPSWTDTKHMPAFMFYTPTFSKNDKFMTAHGEPSEEFPNNPLQVQMQRTLRAYDLAGNTVNRCTVDEINKQLEANGQNKIYQFHHDSIIKEDGNFMSLIANEKLYDGDFPGFEGKKVVLHIDGFIELTPECEVKYSWSWLDHVDPKDSPPHQDQRCDVPVPAASSCGKGWLADETKTEEDPNGIWIDWSHANSIQYIPEDGSIVVDSRNQNSVIKVNYARGKGDGKIIWELGKDKDFEVIPAHEGEQHPWFSAQHSPRLYNNKDLVIFDNSNQRVVEGLVGPRTGSNSRGQVFVLDEEKMIANQTMSAELDGFSYYLGSAQRLANNDTWFLSGFILPNPNNTEGVGVDLMFASVKEGLHSHSYQYKDEKAGGSAAGDMQYKMDNEGVFSYRSYKMHNMYEQETPLDFNVCCIDSDCGAGRTCSCSCKNMKNVDGQDSNKDERQNDRNNTEDNEASRRDERQNGRTLRRLLFGATGGAQSGKSPTTDGVDTSVKCGCVGFL